METKSRYEVISDLESKKRSLIQERDGLNDQVKNKEKNIKELQRQKDDTTIVLQRRIDDSQEELDNFKSTLEDRKETIKELIRSVDDSLARFSKINKE